MTEKQEVRGASDEQSRAELGAEGKAGQGLEPARLRNASRGVLHGTIEP